MIDITRLTAIEIHRHIKNRETTCEEVTNAFLGAISKLDGQLNAFITVSGEYAILQSREIDASLQRGAAPPPLAGIPIAVKDNICTNGVLTTCAAKVLENFVPPYDATVVSKLKENGAVIIGKTNLDQFGMGSSTENSHYGATHNPWDLTRVAGGTSGGSAVAVAAREVPLALASDTGGSSRQPASFCNVIGLKPTYGRVSRYGLIAYASSLDQISIISRNATDCAYLLNAICGPDAKDSTSLPVGPEDFMTGIDGDISGMRIGVPVDFFGKGLDPEIEANVQRIARLLTQLGADCIEIELPSSEYVIPAYYIIATAEASANLARFDGVRYGFRHPDKTASAAESAILTRSVGFLSETKRRILLGTFVLRAGYRDKFYEKAQNVRSVVTRDFKSAFEHCDVLLGPVSPVMPFKIGDKIDDPLSMYLADLYTVSANLAGIPAISVPAGFSKNELPIGVHLQAPHFHESTLLRLAHAIQTYTDYHQRIPPLVTRNSGTGLCDQ